MRSLRHFACALLFLIIPFRSQAQNVRWFEVTSDNFLLFTDTSSSKGQRLLTDLESRVAAFQTAFGSVPKRQFPIEVFLFKQSEDFLGSAPTGAGVDLYTNAYFLKGPDRIFVAARDNSPDDIANDVGHALGHVFLDRLVLWHPFWLEEGAAEFFRKVGRNPDGKRILPEDRLSANDVLSIVPSSTYKDTDPAGPFRIQSYRLMRIVQDQYPAEFRAYLNALKTEEGRDKKLAVNEKDVTERLNPYTELRIPNGAGTAGIQVREISVGNVSVHRGDLLVAARLTSQAEKWYEGDSDEARAARAILAKVVSGNDAMPVLDRAARDFPDRGLVQFYFGSLESQDDKVIAVQTQALENAVRLLPLMGRADAELARVLTVSGQASMALPLLDRAVALEPEYADRFYMVRAEALLALRQYDEGFKTAKLAAALPHADRVAGAAYDRQVALVENRIQEVATAAERLEVDQLRASVETEAARREPPKPPPPPPPPVRAGQVDYQFEAAVPVEVLSPVFPDFPDALVKKGTTGKITLQVSVGVDGLVTNATVVDSQIPELNTSTVVAARKWTFKPVVTAGKPAAFTVKLIFQYSIQ